MKITFAVFYFLQNLSSLDAEYQGTLAILKSGSDVTVDELWLNSSLSETTDLYRHRLPLKHLLGSEPYFRSPLIERWEELEVIWAELNFYNDEGGWMGSYRFAGAQPGYMDVDFVQTENLQSELREVETNLTYGPSIYIYEPSNEACLSFMSINMDSNLASLNGSQFVISAKNDCNYFTNAGGDAQYTSCSKIPILGDIIDVSSVFQCTYHCLTVPNCRYYGIFTNTTANETRYRCVPLTGGPASIQNDCDTLCPDQRPCGKEYIDVNTVLSVSADIYSMVPGVYNDLIAMQNNNISRSVMSFNIDKNSAIDFGSRLFVGGINVRGPGKYMLLMYRDSCEDLFDSDIHLEGGRYYGHFTGQVKEFTTDTVYTFAPVYARCLFFNSTAYLSERAADVYTVTNKFLLADYLRFNAKWNKGACNVTEVMSRRDIVPDSAIEISQSPHYFLDFANGGNFSVPVDSYGVVEIILPGKTEAWIDYLSVTATVNATVTVEVWQNGLCTDKTTKHQRNVSLYGEIMTIAEANIEAIVTFGQFMTNTTTSFCADNITVTIATIEPVTVPSFRFTLKLHGCLLYPDPQLALDCQVENLLDGYYADVWGWFMPRPHLAQNALRPDGNGLMLADIDSEVYVTVHLSNDTDIDVHKVVLGGTLFGAMVEVGNAVKYGSAANGYPIEVEFIDTRATHVHIFDIQRDYNMAAVYLQLTVEIYACVITNGDTGISPTVSPTTFSSVTTHSTEIQPSQSFVSYSPTKTSHTPLLSASVSSLIATSPVGVDSTVLESQHVIISQSISQSVVSPAFVTSYISPTSQTIMSSSVLTPNITTTITSEATSPNSTVTPANSVATTDTSPTTSPNSETTSHLHTTTSEQITLVSKSSTASSRTPTTAGISKSTRQQQGTSATPQCRCWNQAGNITKEKLDIVLKEIVKNLTVPVDKTSVFRRSKISMPDERTSSAVIGAVGIACMTCVTMVVIIMDIDHILKAFNFIKAVITKN